MVRPRLHPAAVDAAALLVFVVVGVLTHGASAGAFGRDVLCILGGWFVVAAVVRLYARAGRWRLAVTWFAGISVGVLVRAAIVGHLAFDFWASRSASRRCSCSLRAACAVSLRALCPDDSGRR